MTMSRGCAHSLRQVRANLIWDFVGNVEDNIVDIWLNDNEVIADVRHHEVMWAKQHSSNIRAGHEMKVYEEDGRADPYHAQMRPCRY